MENQADWKTMNHPALRFLREYPLNFGKDTNFTEVTLTGISLSHKSLNIVRTQAKYT